MSQDILLAELSKEIKTQDGEYTAEPMYVVQSKRRLYGFDKDYTDHTVWVETDGGHEPDEYKQLALDAAYEATDEEPESYTRTGYEDIWEFVTVFFTARGAHEFVKNNKHRHESLRVFVDSGYRNSEWIGLRRFLATYRAQTCATCLFFRRDAHGTFCAKCTWIDDKGISDDGVPPDGCCHRYQTARPLLASVPSSK